MTYSASRWTALLFLAPLLLTACGDDASPALDVPPWAKVAPEQVAEATEHGVPVAFENELGMRFVLVPAGTFMMGSPEDEEGRDEDEFLHEVTIAQPFYALTTEVTKGQYRWFDPWYQSEAALARHVRPPEPDSDEHPVRAGHHDGRHFAAWLTALDDSRQYRLPTEAEWEYCCRAGTQTPFWWGEDGTDSWRHENLRGGWGDAGDGHSGAATVAQYLPNPWGLYDMAGNVCEVCADVYGPYPGADAAALARHDALAERYANHVVTRGATHRDGRVFARSAFRFAGQPYRGRRGFGTETGFRLVSPLPAKDE